MYFAYCTTTRVLMAKQIAQPDSAEQALQLWFQLYFWFFGISESSKLTDFSFWPLRLSPKMEIIRFLPLLGQGLAVFLGLTCKSALQSVPWL
jgi:hypothetical protein